VHTLPSQPELAAFPARFSLHKLNVQKIKVLLCCHWKWSCGWKKGDRGAVGHLWLGAEGGEPSVNLTLTLYALHPPAPFSHSFSPRVRPVVFCFPSLLSFESCLCYSFFLHFIFFVLFFFFVKIAQVRRRHGGWQAGGVGMEFVGWLGV